MPNCTMYSLRIESHHKQLCVYHNKHCHIQHWLQPSYCSAKVDSAFYPLWDGKISKGAPKYTSGLGHNIIIIIQQFVRRRNMSTVTTRAPNNSVQRHLIYLGYVVRISQKKVSGMSIGWMQSQWKRTRLNRQWPKIMRTDGDRSVQCHSNVTRCRTLRKNPLKMLLVL